VARSAFLQLGRKTDGTRVKDRIGAWKLGDAIDVGMSTIEIGVAWMPKALMP
jgi:hypothetical protein